MKTIWITGGSTGIGAETAKKFNKIIGELLLVQEIKKILIKLKNQFKTIL